MITLIAIPDSRSRWSNLDKSRVVQGSRFCIIAFKWHFVAGLLKLGHFKTKARAIIFIKPRQILAEPFISLLLCDNGNCDGHEIVHDYRHRIAFEKNYQEIKTWQDKLCSLNIHTWNKCVKPILESQSKAKANWWAQFFWSLPLLDLFWTVQHSYSPIPRYPLHSRWAR